jgi:hypothetical protein
MSLTPILLSAFSYQPSASQKNPFAVIRRGGSTLLTVWIPD